jgi:hypothetical protein
MAGLAPAIPLLKNAALQSIGITGTRPVMTSRVIDEACHLRAARAAIPDFPALM